MQQIIINTIRQMCKNGTHSCKLHDVILATSTDTKQVTDALQHAPFNTRIARNINDIPLIVLEE